MTKGLLHTLNVSGDRDTKAGFHGLRPITLSQSPFAASPRFTDVLLIFGFMSVEIRCLTYYSSQAGRHLTEDLIERSQIKEAGQNCEAKKS